MKDVQHDKNDDNDNRFKKLFVYKYKQICTYFTSQQDGKSVKISFFFLKLWLLPAFNFFKKKRRKKGKRQ